MDGARILVFFASLAAFVAVYQIGSMSAVSPEEAAIFMNEFEDLVKDIDALGIFLHNTSIVLPMFIPGFGIGWGMFSAWSTGFAFAAIATTTPELAGVSPLAILFLTPFGLMEMVAYSLGVSRSFILIAAIVRKTDLAKHLKPTLVEIAAAVGLLLAGGYIEYALLTLITEDGLQTPLY